MAITNANSHTRDKKDNNDYKRCRKHSENHTIWLGFLFANRRRSESVKASSESPFHQAVKGNKKRNNLVGVGWG